MMNLNIDINKGGILHSYYPHTWDLITGPSTLSCAEAQEILKEMKLQQPTIVEIVDGYVITVTNKYNTAELFLYKTERSTKCL